MANFAKFQTAKWEQFLNKATIKPADANGILKVVFATFGFKDIMSHFRDEMGPQGKWQRLKKQRRRQGKKKMADKPLQDTGRLRGSILPTSTKSTGPGEITVFAAANYSGYHDKGTGRIPKREFMWLSGEALRKMIQFVMDKAWGGA